MSWRERDRKTSRARQRGSERRKPMAVYTTAREEAPHTKRARFTLNISPQPLFPTNPCLRSFSINQLTLSSHPRFRPEPRYGTARAYVRPNERLIEWRERWETCFSVSRSIFMRLSVPPTLSFLPFISPSREPCLSRENCAPFALDLKRFLDRQRRAWRKRLSPCKGLAGVYDHL